MISESEILQACLERIANEQNVQPTAFAPVVNIVVLNNIISPLLQFEQPLPNHGVPLSHRSIADRLIVLFLLVIALVPGSQSPTFVPFTASLGVF